MGEEGGSPEASLRLSKYKFGSEVYSTCYSQAVSHPGTNQALRRIAFETRRDRAFSAWYDRKRQTSFSTNSLRLVTITPAVIHCLLFFFSHF